MIALYTCDGCHHSLTSDYPLIQPVGCPWCHGQQMLRQITSAVDPVAMAKQFSPGVTVEHKLTKRTLLVLELEGDGSTGWFTARDDQMQTFRVRYVEVEPKADADGKPVGQYL
jgi:hypothetical protein